MHDDELTTGEREALRALPRAAQPSDLLEERTVQALVSRGLLQPRRRLPVAIGWIGAAAACLVFFVAGFGVGASRTARRADETGFAAPAAEALAQRHEGSKVSARPEEQAVESEKPVEGEQPASVSGAVMDTAGGLAFTDAPANRKQRTQVVVWF